MKLPEPLWMRLCDAIEHVMAHAGCNPCLEEISPERKDIESRLSQAFADGEIRTRGVLIAPRDISGPTGRMEVSEHAWARGTINWSKNRITRLMRQISIADDTRPPDVPKKNLFMSKLRFTEMT